MNKKILISLSLIAAIGVVVIGATTAYFSDTETSTGNTFSAGAIDLGIDNESYYNGVLNDGTTWSLTYNLDDEQGPGEGGKYFFFNFDDIKPGDWGEDTISLHVNNNDAWACMEIELTATDDNECTEPEAEEDDTCGPQEGELQNEINFIWWNDDGDNVLEVDEESSVFGQTLLADLDGLGVILTDSSGNGIFGSDPLTGSQDYYIGKAWCFGDLTLTPVAQGDNDPTLNSGVICDGAPVTNISQTDSVEGNITFKAIQSRNNSGFRCFAIEGFCGDGNLDSGEGCDEGQNNGVECTPDYDSSCNYCSINCETIELQGPYCGDGNLDEPYEECDDGNTEDGDGCSANCTTEELGCIEQADVMLTLDRSGSISPGEMTALKAAAHDFVNALDPSTDEVHMGQVSFSDTGSLDLHLTGNKATIDATINALVSGGYTNLYEGILYANGELADGVHDRNDVESPDFMVIITDGEPNRPTPNATARAQAIAQADAADAVGTIIYVVGVGVIQSNADWLKNNIATTPSHYFNAGDWSDLEAILQAIAECQ